MASVTSEGKFMKVLLGLIGLCTLLLTGCTGDGQAPKTLSLTPDKGLMIVGVAIDHYDTQFGETAYGSVETLSLGWIRWEGGKPVPTTFSSSDKMILNLESCGILRTSRSGDCDLRKMQYYVIQADPGTYGLGAFTRFLGNMRNITEIKSHDQIMTHIDAGKIAYIGDLTLDAVDDPIRIVNYGRNDEGARQALSGYPNVRADIVYEKPTPSPQ
jgi:hypothetical protein